MLVGKFFFRLLVLIYVWECVVVLMIGVGIVVMSGIICVVVCCGERVLWVWWVWGGWLGLGYYCWVCLFVDSGLWFWWLWWCV